MDDSLATVENHHLCFSAVNKLLVDGFSAAAHANRSVCRPQTRVLGRHASRFALARLPGGCVSLPLQSCTLRLQVALKKLHPQLGKTEAPLSPSAKKKKE